MQRTASVDPVGVHGLPKETLQAFRDELRQFDLKRTNITLITDWQDQRQLAHYAVLAWLRHSTPERSTPERVVLSADAFGPRFGDHGQRALETLISELCARGVVDFKEAIVPAYEFSRLLESVSVVGLRRIVAVANPSDPALYLKHS